MSASTPGQLLGTCTASIWYSIANGPFGSSNVLAHFMFDQALFSFRVGYGAAIAVVLFIIMDIYIAFFLWRMLQQEKRGGM